MVLLEAAATALNAVQNTGAYYKVDTGGGGGSPGLLTRPFSVSVVI